jgi:hypothetical protein
MDVWMTAPVGRGRAPIIRGCDRPPHHPQGAAERIVLGFNYEEYTAVAGPAGWDRVVGCARTLWSDWRPSVFQRYLVAIPRLAVLHRGRLVGMGSPMDTLAPATLEPAFDVKAVDAGSEGHPIVLPLRATRMP